MHEWLNQLAEEHGISGKPMLVCRFLAANPHAASYQPASQIARQTGVNSATVVRLAQALGFPGWPAFQSEMRHHFLRTLAPHETANLAESSLAGGSLNASLRRDAENLQLAQGLGQQQVIDAMAQAIYEAGRTLVIASGTYASVGHTLAHVGSAMGYPITLEMRGGAHLVAGLASMQDGDCVVAISFWRTMRETVVGARLARDRGLAVCAVTDSTYSPLAEVADHVLVVPTEGVLSFQSMTAPVSAVYGLLGRLFEVDPERCESSIRRTEAYWEALDVLHLGS